jgi:hypothetical protein
MNAAYLGQRYSSHYITFEQASLSLQQLLPLGQQRPQLLLVA